MILNYLLWHNFIETYCLLACSVKSFLQLVVALSSFDDIWRVHWMGRFEEYMIRSPLNHHDIFVVVFVFFYVRQAPCSWCCCRSDSTKGIWYICYGHNVYFYMYLLLNVVLLKRNCKNFALRRIILSTLTYPKGTYSWYWGFRFKFHGCDFC
jgi:hypothetical protein